MGDWEPGDVAMVRVGTGDWEYGIRREDGTWGCRHTLNGFHERDVQAAPVVVIDPDNREQIERLLRGYAGWKADPDDIKNYPEYVDHMQAALREFANPTPPIEEPTALYAVVRDDCGHEWCHIGGQVWRSLTSTGQYMVEKHWHDSDSPLADNVVAILSPGYTEDGA